MAKDDISEAMLPSVEFYQQLQSCFAVRKKGNRFVTVVDVGLLSQLVNLYVSETSCSGCGLNITLDSLCSLVLCRGKQSTVHSV